ncbi:hypothetical protein ZWY2020_046854 [Hordeum vulgare]|nr:hypothetical protein ZWY2020_046854 [Hordeum vulgare]
MRCNGITRDAVAAALGFSRPVHNIVRFDVPRIREAFIEIGRHLQSRSWDDRSHCLCLPSVWEESRSIMKAMPQASNYFGLGRQKHRSLDDVRMNLEVLKYCATVLFLEASLPEVLIVENLVGTITRSKTDGATSLSLLHLCCGLEYPVWSRYKFLDTAGRQKFNMLVEIPETLSKVLEFCDNQAQRFLQDSGTTSEWRPLIKKYGYVNRPTVRLNIPTTASSDAPPLPTDIYQKDQR